MASTFRRRPLHIDTVHLLHEASDVTLAAHLDPKGARAVGQHGFEARLIDCVGTSFRLFLRVLSDKRQASEMATELRRSTTQVRSGLLCELVHRREAARLFGGDGRGHPATL
jgi:hypothetical protein